MPMIGPLEIMLVGVVALLVFGPEKLPEMARTVGRTANQLRRMAADLKEEFNAELEDDDDEDRPEARRSTGAPGHGVPTAGSEGAEVEQDDDPHDDIEPDDDLHDDLAPDEGPPRDPEREGRLREDLTTRDAGDESKPDGLSAGTNRRSQAVPDRSTDTDE